jgi:hypothetical protein
MEQNGMSDTSKVLGDLIRVFQDTDDLELLTGVTQMGEEMEDFSQKREQSLNQTLQQLDTAMSKLKVQTANPPANAFKTQQADLLIKKTQISKQIENLIAEINTEKQALGKLAEDDEHINANKENVEQALDTVVPRLSHVLKLYCNVSKIIWDFDRAATDTSIKGTMHMVNSKQVRPFEVSQQDGLSEMEIADKLWDTMWTDFN